MSSQAPGRGGAGTRPGAQPATHLSAYLATATLARMTSEAVGPALLVVVIAVLGSASTGSYLVAALTAAAAVAGPVIGVAFDRTQRPARAFAIAMTSVGGGIAVLALAVGHVPLGWLVVIAGIAGIGMPALTGAWTAQLPGLVPAERLRRAHSADAATYSVAAVVGPPLASALVVVGAVAPLWLPVATIIVALALLRWVPLRPRHAISGETPTTHDSRLGMLVADLRRGFGAMFGIPRLRRIVVTTTLINAGQAAVVVAAPLVSLERTGELGFTGVILGVFAAGDVLAAAFIVRWPIRRPDRAIMWTTMLSGIALLGIGFAPTTWLMLASAFVMGAIEAPLISAMFQVRNRESPPAVVAQVFTAGSSMRMTMTALGTAIYGLVLHNGVGWVVVIGAGIHFLAVGLGLLAGPPLPRRRTESMNA